MVEKGLIGACLGLAMTVACSSSNQPAKQQPPAPPPVSGPAAAVQTNSYEAVGVVKSLNPKRPGIEVNHEEVVGLMPAMQMEFPVTDASLLNGIAVNDRIDFTIVDGTGEMKITAIKKK
jgi:Cu/Ag efflux protein CusF